MSQHKRSSRNATALIGGCGMLLILVTLSRAGQSNQRPGLVTGNIARTAAAPHWAWRKPIRAAIPAVTQRNWVQNPIDQFVAARLEKEALPPSPAADRYTLIRRVSLDLTGLPPMPHEVEQFVNDERPDAYERLVDRLLSEPACGERWARMWLDLARYADSKGYGSDPLRTIWRYRDWVIDAFNRNLPYDRFTIEQLAGDLLPNATHDQLLATAFHRNTMANDEGGTDDEEFRVAAVKDRVDSTMQIWMGITLGCAKCHSHKFDPISQRDYYSLFAFFNQTEDADRGDEEPRLRSPSREQTERIDDLKSQIAQLKHHMHSPAGELADKLAAAQRQWEAAVVAQTGQWVVLDPREFSSANGTVLRKLDDASLLASGASPGTETYTVIVPAEREGITAIRLEALAHESLPEHGPGRANGNFVLNDLRLTVANRDATPLAGRFIRIEVPGVHRILSLAEVQVFGDTMQSSSRPAARPTVETAENLALKGKAAQSSTDYDGPPQLATDGNTNGHYFEAKSTTHTRAEDNPWWEVDLGTMAAVDRVVIWNRTDGGVGTRLNNFRVALLGEDRQPVWETKVAEPPSPSVRLAVGGPASASLKNATSDFDQADFPVAKAIDTDAGAKSGWAVAPQTGRLHEAVFELATPVGSEKGATLTFTLAQTFGAQHTLGRFRLSATTATPAPRALPGHVAGILAIPADQRSAEQANELARHYRSMAPELQSYHEQIKRLEVQLKELDKQVPLIPVLRELPAEKRRQTHLLIKGNFLTKGDAIEPRVPSAFHDLPHGLPANRLGLAQWLVSPDNPLTARVAVNRFWSQLFGRGLVETEEDFGTQGEPPSHPELLDWLAVEFMEPSACDTPQSALCASPAGAWDVKRLLRLIVTSATYRQTSTPSPELMRRDPDNRLLARGPRHRLEAEMVRDQALALSGLLSRKVGGPSVYPPQPEGLWRAAFNGERTWATSRGEDRYRRGLYTFWRRTVPYPSMATFDAPSREICTIRRTPTNTPLQAFVTLNDPVYVEAAQALARRIVREGGGTTEDRAEFGLRLCLCRRPRGEQIRELVALYESQLAIYRTDDVAARQIATEPLGPAPDQLSTSEWAAWTVAANVLLNLDGVLALR